MNSSLPEVSVQQVKSMLDEGHDFLLLDCREDQELQIAKLTQAKHIPMGDIPSRLQEIDPDQEIVVMCHHGQRSLSVTMYLQQQDFESVWSMAGGIHAWSQEIDSSVPVY